MNYKFLINYLQEYYENKYTNISKDVKNEIIYKLIMNNHEIFPMETVIGFDGCTKCGYCCERQNCSHFNKETRLCSDYKNRSKLCKLFPYGEESIYLSVNCPYVLNFLKYNIEKIFSDFK